MKREDIDFFIVAPEHIAIHESLLNWARWVGVRSHGWAVSPMFRQYRSNAWQWERPEIRSKVDELAALAMERLVSGLPDKHRMAIRWQYVLCGHPGRMARHLAVSKQGLADLVRDGRAMLKNRQ